MLDAVSDTSPTPWSMWNLNFAMGLVGHVAGASATIGSMQPLGPQPTFAFANLLLRIPAGSISVSTPLRRRLAAADAHEVAVVDTCVQAQRDLAQALVICACVCRHDASYAEAPCKRSEMITATISQSANLF